MFKNILTIDKTEGFDVVAKSARIIEPLSLPLKISPSKMQTDVEAALP